MQGKMLTPSEFDLLAQRQLIVRCLVEDGKIYSTNKKPSKITRIELFNSMRDCDTNLFFTHLVYTDEHDSEGERDTHKTMVGLELNYFSSEQLERMRELQTLFDKWDHETAPWCLAAPAVACRKTSRQCSIIPTLAFELMQHYARLQTRIAYEIEVHDPSRRPHHSGWVLGGIFYRLTAFIRDYNRDWIKVIGAEQF